MLLQLTCVAPRRQSTIYYVAPPKWLGHNIFDLSESIGVRLAYTDSTTPWRVVNVFVVHVTMNPQRREVIIRQEVVIKALQELAMVLGIPHRCPRSGRVIVVHHREP